jgi:hypothetical protein
MTSYLLTCECGKSVSVEIGQAGERVNCQCGRALDVPPLRKLRHLPVAAAELERSSSTWSPRYGIIAACLILATALAIWALWSRLTELRVEPFDANVHQQAVDRYLETITPAEGWRRWVEWYRPLAERGFTEMQHPDAAHIELHVGEQRFLQMMLLAVGGVFVAVAVIAAVWPGEKTRRQGDKETRRKH